MRPKTMEDYFVAMAASLNKAGITPSVGYCRNFNLAQRDAELLAGTVVTLQKTVDSVADQLTTVQVENDDGLIDCDNCSDRFDFENRLNDNGLTVCPLCYDLSLAELDHIENTWRD